MISSSAALGIPYNIRGSCSLSSRRWASPRRKNSNYPILLVCRYPGNVDIVATRSMVALIN